MSELYSDLVELKALGTDELVTIIGGKNAADDTTHAHKQKGKKPKAPKVSNDGPNHT